MNYRKLVDVALLAGEIMLVSGGETYRVEDTTTRILKMSGFTNAQAIVIGMSISVSLADDQDVTITCVRRADERANDLGKLYRVNNISRRFCSGHIGVDEAYAELKQIKESVTYGSWQRFLGTVGSIMFFAVLLGGSYYDFAFASINGLIVAICIFIFDRIHMNLFFKNLLSACAVAITSVFIHQVLKIPISLDVVISGAILPLLPGVAITNAIRDTLRADYISGTARALEAFVMATAIAIGIGIGLIPLK